MDIVDVVELGEVVGIALGVIGSILTIVICALPTWIETTFIAANFTTPEVVLHGLWMSCDNQSMGQTQCKVYNSMGFWPHVLQSARAMILTAIILGVLGVLVSIVGAKCTKCIKEETSQAKLIIMAGILFTLAGILIIIPVSLVARSIIIDSSKWIEGKIELGASLYFGWVAAALLLIGGVILCITLGIFGWMMGIFGWIVSIVPCYISCALTIVHLDHYSHVNPYRVKCMVTSISTTLGALGVMGSIFGTKCCNCIKSNRTRVKARFIVGIFFTLAGNLQLTTVLLTYFLTHTFTEYLFEVWLFSAEFSRWAASMLLIGGTILCCSTLKRKKPDSTTTK